MTEQHKILIRELHEKGISVAGITSILYHKGLSGIRYFELRKHIFKEIQRTYFE